MPPKETPQSISLEDLLVLNATNKTDLDFLGLGGLPDALTAYDIENTEDAEEIIRRVASAAFKAFSRELHPDVGGGDEDDFRIIHDSLKRINADPSGAIRQERSILSGRSDLEEAVEQINIFHETKKTVGELRRQKVELLYGLPYSAIFGVKDDQPVEFQLDEISNVTNLQNGRALEVMLYDDPERFAGVGQVVTMRIEGDEAAVQTIHYGDVTDLEDVKALSAAEEEDEGQLGENEDKLDKLFSKGRIIGFVPEHFFRGRGKNSRVSSRGSSSRVPIELPRVNDPDPLAGVSGDVESDPMVDYIQSPIPENTSIYSNGRLVFAHHDKQGRFKIGVLGTYTTKK